MCCLCKGRRGNTNTVPGIISEGLAEVIVYGSADNPRLKNRGFAFLDYDTHKNASNAKRKLSTGKYRVWQCDIIVDWADPQEEPDEETMAKVGGEFDFLKLALIFSPNCQRFTICICP